MSIREASLALGVSELTIRRRIKTGRLANRLQNGKYYVNFDLTVEPQPQPEHRPDASRPAPTDQSEPETASSSLPTSQRDTTPLELFLPEYARLAEQAGRAAILGDEVRRLQEEQRELQESLIALAGRNGWLESRLEEREEQLRMLEDSRPRRRWWHRLTRRGVATG
jgi:hypothetical protein